MLAPGTMGEKRKISMRLDELDLELLDKVSEIEHTSFYGKNRTQLVVEAIRKVYLPLMGKKDGKEEELN